MNGIEEAVVAGQDEIVTCWPKPDFDKVYRVDMRFVGRAPMVGDVVDKEIVDQDVVTYMPRCWVMLSHWSAVIATVGEQDADGYWLCRLKRWDGMNRYINDPIEES